MLGGDGAMERGRNLEVTMTQSKTIVHEVKPEITADNGSLMIVLPNIKEAQGRPSASGKSKVLSSTRGNVYVAELDCYVGLNVYRK